MKPYYDHKGITLYHGDMREILPTLKGNLILTDPPYGCDVEYGTSYKDNREGYWEWFLPAVDLMRATCPLTIFTHRNEALRHVKGWDWVGVWSQPGSSGARIGNSPVLAHWEPIFMFGIHSVGTGGEYLPDVIAFNPVRSGNAMDGSIGRAQWKKGVQPNHPTPKPIGLFAKLMRSFSKDSDVIIDPFAGSGTTLRAAKELGRKAIGIEIEERYCDMIAKRMAQEVLF